MSSIPGRRLEDFITDAWLWPKGGPTPELFAQVVALYEPARESIERQLSDYDEETQSWRDYRNAMTVPTEIENAADLLITGAKP